MYGYYLSELEVILSLGQFWLKKTKGGYHKIFDNSPMPKQEKLSA